MGDEQNNKTHIAQVLIELEQISFYQNDPWKKVIWADTGLKYVAFIDFLKNRVMRMTFFAARIGLVKMFISVFV